MSLAAEDQDEASYLMHRPCHPVQHSSRSGAYGTAAVSRCIPHEAYASSDTMAAIAHSLLGGSRLDAESRHAVLASVMADFGAAGGMHAASSAMSNGHQDMSYEALTNLEDVKLTAPLELLATMPLDMCLKGSPWEQKVCINHCHLHHLTRASLWLLRAVTTTARSRQNQTEASVMAYPGQELALQIVHALLLWYSLALLLSLHTRCSFALKSSAFFCTLHNAT